MLLGIFCTNLSFFNTASGMDCMQFELEMVYDRAVSCFNTASGMDCMQWGKSLSFLATSQFQYRKRYGLHAITDGVREEQLLPSFNTASGMDCMQSENAKPFFENIPVSIPQAVWIACNCLAVQC